VETKLIFNRVYDFMSNIEIPAESKMGAVFLGFRWILASLLKHRLSPTCHDSVSHPRSSNKGGGTWPQLL